jgi:hypothetical protein
MFRDMNMLYIDTLQIKRERKKERERRNYIVTFYNILLPENNECVYII